MYLEIVRGGPNLVFWKIDHHSRTFFWLSPIYKVKFGLLEGGAWPNAPLNTPLITWVKKWWGKCPTLATHSDEALDHKLVNFYSLLLAREDATVQ